MRHVNAWRVAALLLTLNVAGCDRYRPAHPVNATTMDNQRIGASTGSQTRMLTPETNVGRVASPSEMTDAGAGLRERVGRDAGSR